MGTLRRLTRAELERGGLDFEELLDDIAGGKTLAVCCAELSLSAYVVLNWVRADAERSAGYDRAQAVSAEIYVQECVPIADELDVDPQQKKVRIDTRLKIAGKWDKRKYGEQSGVSINLGSNSLVAILSGMGSAPAIAEQDAIEGEVVEVTPEKIPEKNSEILPVPLTESDVAERRRVEYI